MRMGKAASCEERSLIILASCSSTAIYLITFNSVVEAASVVELKGCVVVAVVVVVVFFLFLLNRSKAGIRMSGNLAMGLRNGGRLLILGLDVVDESAETKK